ncbi:MAG: protocatechuate 3,4-dioxygenase [Bdellovibrionota bacterium]
MKAITRRDLIMGTVKTTSALGILAPIVSVLGATPSQTEGPFHPVNQDNDLTRKTPDSPLATGQIIYLYGTVKDEQGRPLSNAIVELWQAAANGKYNHPGDPNPKPVDPNFQYWGRDVTDLSGKFAFKTIKPGEYPADTNWTRPAHIHFRILRPGFEDLTTQMYFSPETTHERDLIEKDLILNALTPADRKKVIIDFKAAPASSGLESDAQVGVFPIEMRATKRS